MRVASSSLPHHSLKHATLSPNREMNGMAMANGRELWMMRIRIICRLHHVPIIPYHIIFITLHNFTVNLCSARGWCHFLHRIACRVFTRRIKNMSRNWIYDLAFWVVRWLRLNAVYFTKAFICIFNMRTALSRSK